VLWVYGHLENIPHRIQEAVNRQFAKEQDKLLDIKQEAAEQKVKIILASQFPSLYKKKYLDPYEEESELYDENLAFLSHIQEVKEDGEVVKVKAKW
jgi:hypothetical protein